MSSVCVALMGDIVQSESAHDRAALHRHFNVAIDRQNARRADVPSPLTITLGDAFQGLAASFVAAGRIARALRFELLEAAIDCRFAIGAVMLDTPLNPACAWNMMGDGLAATRERLDEKSAISLYRFVIPDDLLLESFLDASGATLTAIERGWSTTQRKDIVALLDGVDVTTIARRRAVSVQNVYKVRASGDYELYALQWQAIERALTELDRRYGTVASAR